MTLSVTGPLQIDVESFVSDPHRTAAQLDRFPVFTRNQSIVLKSSRWLVQCCWLDRILRNGRLAERNPHQRDLCGACILDGIPLLQKTHCRSLSRCAVDSVFMDLTVLPTRIKLCKKHRFPRQP